MDQGFSIILEMNITRNFLQEIYARILYLLLNQKCAIIFEVNIALQLPKKFCLKSCSTLFMQTNVKGSRFIFLDLLYFSRRWFNRTNIQGSWFIFLNLLYFSRRWFNRTNIQGSWFIFLYLLHFSRRRFNLTWASFL